MSNQNSKKSQLVQKIKNLDFVRKVEVNSITRITCRNFEDTLVYNKNLQAYIANVNFIGHNYKLLISIDKNKPNPKYEKKIKKVF